MKADLPTGCRLLIQPTLQLQTVQLCSLFFLSAPFFFFTFPSNAFFTLTLQLYQLLSLHTSFLYRPVTEVLRAVKINLSHKQYKLLSTALSSKTQPDSGTDIMNTFNFILVLCDTWNWSDDNDTISGIAILDTTAIPEMRYAISMSFRIHQSQTIATNKNMCTVRSSVLWVGAY